MGGGGAGVYITFAHLKSYWREVRQHNAPFYALLLSTENTDVDAKITNYTYENPDELHDMSGKDCWIFTPVPKGFILGGVIAGQELYSIGRLFDVLPEQFPCIVFFDRLTRPKQVVVVSIASILGSNPTKDEITSFFRSLFSITQSLADSPIQKRAKLLHEKVLEKWDNKKTLGARLTRVVELVKPLSEIIKNMSEAVSSLV